MSNGEVYKGVFKAGKRHGTGICQLKSGALYKGEWRVDTHPRFSPDGKLVCIDAPLEGQGRQLHLIDIGAVTHENR